MSYVSASLEANAIVVELSTSRLDAANASHVKSEILSAVSSNKVRNLIIDMGSVTFLDSSGLGALVSVRKNLPEDHEIELRNTVEFVAKVLRLTKMDRVFSL